MAWGGKRQGAGRPRQEHNFVRDSVARGRGTRTGIYRDVRRITRLTVEAQAFLANAVVNKFITGKALDVAGEFETAEDQIAVLRLAIDLRKARQRLTYIRALKHLRDSVT